MTTFVGRAPLVERIRALVDDTRGGALTFTGEPGIGKSALIDMASGRAAAQGFAVLRADADELGTTQPYGTLGALLSAASPSVGGGSGAGAGTATWALLADAPPLAMVDRLLEAAELGAGSTTPLIAVDNLQWADQGSLTVLASVMRRTVPLGWRFVFGARTAPWPDALSQLLVAAAEVGGSEVAVEPLTDAETLALVRDQIGGVPSRDLQLLVRQAGGNPFYLTTLLRELHHDQRLIRTEGATVGLRVGDTPTTLARIIVRRAQALGPDAFDVLRAAAVLGRHSSLADLAALLDTSTDQLQAVRGAAAEAGLLDPSDPGFGFRHDLVVAALRDQSPTDERTNWHMRALHLLRSADARADLLAPHLLALPVDPQQLDEIARVAEACAPDVGLLLVEKALAAGSDPDFRLIVLRGHLLLWSGRLREAVDAATLALDTHGALGPLNSLRSVQSRGTFLLGEARSWAPDHPDDLEPAGLPFITPERYKAEMSVAVLFAGQAQRALRLATDALDMNTGSAAADEAITDAVAASVCGMLHSAGGRVSEGHGCFRRMAAALQRDPSDASYLGPELFHASALLMLGDLQGASAAVDRDDATADFAVTLRLPVRHAIRAAVLFERGDWDSAIAEADASALLSRELGVAVQNNYSSGVRALVSALRGDVDGAAAILGDPSAGVGVEWTAWAHLAVAEARSDLATALMVGRMVIDGFAAAGVGLLGLQLAPRVARLTVATGGDIDGLRAVLHTLDVDAQAPVAMAHRQWALGWLDDDTEAISAAAHALTHAGYTFEGVDAWRDVGRRTGALPPKAAQAAAAALGLQEGVASRSPVARPGGSGAAFGWEALSAAERRVLDLLAEGLDNAAIAARLFVSRRTVESHLGHVYTKLGISGRSRLVAEVLRRRTR